MLFTRDSQYPVGLDISDSSIKISQLQKLTGKIVVQAIGSISLHQSVIKDSNIMNNDEIIRKIKMLVDKPGYGKLTSKKVVASLPEAKTFIKLIEINSGPNGLKNVLEFEIQKHVPLSINEMYFDWQIVEESGDNKVILVSAAPKELVNQYANILDKAGFLVEALEVEPISICRSLLVEEAPQFSGGERRNIIIASIGEQEGSIIVYSHDTILFTMSIQSSPGRDGDIFSQGRDKIIDALDYYNNHFSDRGQISQILINGRDDIISPLITQIEKDTKTSVQRGDIFTNLNQDKSISAYLEKEKNSDYAKAVGLALRGIFIN